MCAFLQQQTPAAENFPSNKHTLLLVPDVQVHSISYMNKTLAFLNSYFCNLIEFGFGKISRVPDHYLNPHMPLFNPKFSFKLLEICYFLCRTLHPSCHVSYTPLNLQTFRCIIHTLIASKYKISDITQLGLHPAKNIPVLFPAPEQWGKAGESP